MKPLPQVKWHLRLLDFVLFRKRNCKQIFRDREIHWDSNAKKTVVKFGTPHIFNTLPKGIQQNFGLEEPADELNSTVNPLSDAAPGVRELTGVHFNDSPFAGRGIKLKEPE